MKKILVVVFILCSFFASAQYNPSNATYTTPLNKPIGITNKPVDARTYYYDATFFTYRAYVSVAEANSWVTGNARKGLPLIVVNTGGTLNSGVITGGTNAYMTWRDGVADVDLVPIVDAAVTASQGIFKSGSDVQLGGNITSAITVLNVGPASLFNLRTSSSAAGASIKISAMSPSTNDSAYIQFSGLNPSPIFVMGTSKASGAGASIIQFHSVTLTTPYINFQTSNSGSSAIGAIRLRHDTLVLSQTSGRYKFENLGASSDTTTYKPMAFNSSGIPIRLSYWPSGSGVSGLTATRVPFALSATVLQDASTFTFTSGAGVLTAPSIALTPATTTRAPIMMGTGFMTNPTTLSNGMMWISNTDSSIRVQSGGNTFIYPYKKDLVAGAGVTFGLGGAWNIPDTLIAAASAVTTVGTGATLLKSATQVKSLLNNYSTVISGGTNEVTVKVDSSVFAPLAKSIVAATPTNLRSDASSVLKLSDGSLYLAVTAYGSQSGDADSAVIVSYRSFDNGRTWSDKDTVVPMSGTGVYIPSLYYNNARDTIYSVYYRQNTTTTGQIYQTYSVDNGETWSAGASIYGTGSEYFSPAADRVFRSKSGDLFYPFCINTNGTLTSSTGNYRGRLLRRVNGLNAWAIVAGVDIGSLDSLCVEPGLFETDEGLLTFYWRARTGWVGFAKSTTSAGTAYGASYWSGLQAPNSTTSIIYNESNRVLIAAHNRLLGAGFINGLPARVMMDLSVSPGNSIGGSWFPLMTIDSLTGNVFLEPTLTMNNNNELLVSYGYGGNTTGDTVNQRAKIIPFSYIPNANISTQSAITLRKSFSGDDGDWLRFYNVGISESTNFMKIQNQTNSMNFFAPWVRVETTRSSGDLLLFSVNGSTSGSFFSFDGTTASGAAAATQRVFEVTNNGTAVHTIFASGKMNLGSIAGDPSGLANGDIWYNSSSNKFRAYENGSAVDMIGGASGSFIASNTGTTLTGNVDITQGGNRFALNEQLLIGTTTSPGATVLLGIVKATGSPTFYTEAGSASTSDAFLWDARRTVASSYNIGAGTPVIEFRANTVSKLRFEAVGLASDSYNNVALSFSGRTDNEAMSQRHIWYPDGTYDIFKKGGTGSSVSFFRIYQRDLSVSDAVWDHQNGTSGTSGGANFIFTKSLGTLAGYGLSIDIRTTAASAAALDINAHNSGSAITSNNILNVKSNGTSRFAITGSGAATITGSLTITTALTVPNGGTGIATTTAYGLIAGGTTSTGAFQNTGAGTSGQLLKSNGASALPSFVDANSIYQSATWSPTVTYTTNTSATSTTSLRVQQVGDVIHFWGSVVLIPSGAGVVQIDLSLPFSNAITVAADISGTGVAFDKAAEPVEIFYNTGGGTMAIKTTSTTGTRTYKIHGIIRYIAP